MIDSDYQVEPFWLQPRHAAISPLPESPWCRGRRIIATPRENLFKAMAYEEYRGFFHIGMVERNEHNAIIQHGTMTIVARKTRWKKWAAGANGASPRTPSWA